MQVLDHEQFDALRTQLAPAVFMTLVQSFSDACPVQLHQLSLCATAGDMPGLSLAAHQLRGFAANFGARRMADLAAEIGRACEAGDASALSEMVRDMAEVSSQTWVEIMSSVTPVEP